MKGNLKKILSAILVIAMSVGMCVSASASRIASCLNNNLVLNIYTWGTPAAGNKVSLWTDEGHNEQRWTMSYLGSEVYLVSNANSSITLACAGDYSAVMENKNDVYGEWQQHHIRHGNSTVQQFFNRGCSYQMRLRVDRGAKSGSMAYYGDIGYNERDDIALSWSVT